MYKKLRLMNLLMVCALVAAFASVLAAAPARVAVAESQDGEVRAASDGAGDGTGSEDGAGTADGTGGAGDAVGANDAAGSEDGAGDAAGSADGTGDAAGSADGTGDAAGANGAAGDIAQGSITLTFVDEKGTVELVGGRLDIYCVATEKVIVGEDGFTSKVFDLSGGQFATSQAASSIPGITDEELDKQNRTIAEALEAEAKANGLKPIMTASIQSGKVVFSPLKRGLYLIFQSELSEGKKKSNTFLMTVPGTGGSLDVVTKPKAGVYTPENPPDNSSSSSQTTSSSVTQGTNQTTTSTTRSAQPRTADDTTPMVPVAIAVLGLVSFVAAKRFSQR